MPLQMPPKSKLTRKAAPAKAENEEHAAKKTKFSPMAKAKAPGSGANSKPQRPEDSNVPSTRSGVFRTLVSSRLLEPVLAPYCTTRMLEFLSMTCRWLEAPVLLVLTTRREWRLSAIKQWSESRLAYVHHLLYDSSSHLLFDSSSLPRGLTGLTRLRFNFNFNLSLMTDQGVQSLASLTALTTLNLAECSLITDQGVQSLTSLTALTTLNLAECSLITDQGVCSP